MKVHKGRQSRLLDGRLVSQFLLKQVGREVKRLKKRRIHPKLVIILVGQNPASLSYIRQKEKAAGICGIFHIQKNLQESTTTSKLIKLIEKLNADKTVHGILVQLPLPHHVQTSLVMRAIDPKKDVDGFGAYNLGKMFLAAEFEHLSPCTPAGILKLLEFYKIPLAGKHAVIIGRSNIVGKPLSMMMLNRDATVTVCHSRTKNLGAHTRQADILIAAVGRPRMVKANMVKKGAIVIDVGVTKIENTLVGDIDFKNVSKKAAFITPVPGGVGPMTVACLMENVVKAASRMP